MLMLLFSACPADYYYHYYCSVPVLLIAAAVPWMLPWDQISVPWLPSIHVVACLAPWVWQQYLELL